MPDFDLSTFLHHLRLFIVMGGWVPLLFAAWTFLVGCALRVWGRS